MTFSMVCDLHGDFKHVFFLAVTGHQNETILILADENSHQNSQLRWTSGAKDTPVPNNEKSTIAARLKTNQIRQKQKKIFQN